MLLGRQSLVAKEDHAVLVERLANVGDCFRVQRVRQINRSSAITVVIIRREALARIGREVSRRELKDAPLIAKHYDERLLVRRISEILSEAKE